MCGQFVGLKRVSGVIYLVNLNVMAKKRNNNNNINKTFLAEGGSYKDS